MFLNLSPLVLRALPLTLKSLINWANKVADVGAGTGIPRAPSVLHNDVHRGIREMVGPVEGNALGKADGCWLFDGEADCKVLWLVDGDTLGVTDGNALGFVDGFVDGLVDGEPDGHCDGFVDGLVDGEPDGRCDGFVDGLVDGFAELDGRCDGLVDGEPDGRCDGFVDGSADGFDEVDGRCDGCVDGLVDGKSDGHCEGFVDGLVDGEPDGRCDGFVDGLVDGLAELDGLLDGLNDDLDEVDGLFDGLSDGLNDGFNEVDGVCDGLSDGFSDGIVESDGLSDGLNDGFDESDGLLDGLLDGLNDGFDEVDGVCDGLSVGFSDGIIESDGLSDGLSDRLSVGLFVGINWLGLIKLSIPYTYPLKFVTLIPSLSISSTFPSPTWKVGIPSASQIVLVVSPSNLDGILVKQFWLNSNGEIARFTMCVDKKSSIDKPGGSKVSNDCPLNAVFIGANNVNCSSKSIFQSISLELLTESRDEKISPLLLSKVLKLIVSLKSLHNLENWSLIEDEQTISSNVVNCLTCSAKELLQLTSNKTSAKTSCREKEKMQGAIVIDVIIFDLESLS
jgi:hypothetical protein